MRDKQLICEILTAGRADNQQEDAVIYVTMIDLIDAEFAPCVIAAVDEDTPAQALIEIESRRDLAPWLPFLKDSPVVRIGSTRTISWSVFERRNA